MVYKCPKCESENVDVTANKRGALVGKCRDCKKWGNYGNQNEEEGSKEKSGQSGQKAGTPKQAKGNTTPPAAGRSTKRKPTAKAGRKRTPQRPIEPVHHAPEKQRGFAGALLDFFDF